MAPRKRKSNASVPSSSDSQALVVRDAPLEVKPLAVAPPITKTRRRKSQLLAVARKSTRRNRSSRRSRASRAPHDNQRVVKYPGRGVSIQITDAADNVAVDTTEMYNLLQRVIADASRPLDLLSMLFT